MERRGKGEAVAGTLIRARWMLKFVGKAAVGGDASDASDAVVLCACPLSLQRRSQSR